MAGPLKYPPVSPKFPHFLHGGDYNPDQWTPDVWAEDMRLMKLAHCNAMSVGIFSWTHLEPEEGRYTFEWLDRIMDLLAENDAYAVLATPSAAHPAWLTAKHPDIMRVDRNGTRRKHEGRVSYCLTSPVFREHSARIAAALAQRYKDHPALLLWHVHNEYGGECWCDLCQEAFREWLQAKYQTLDALNHAYWSAFWSQTFTDWSQLHPGNGCMMGLQLDWRRFTSDQTIACYRNEASALRAVTPNVPVTTNTYSMFVNYIPQDFAAECDVIAWDNYPMYHDRPSDVPTAAGVSFLGDFYRCLKGGQPFLLMESTPSSTNWMPVEKLKRPGMHVLSSLQAVAHGADSVQYFQWRKSRGGAEKFHGAVVDHAGHENTRVFGEVAELGQILEKLDGVIGTSIRPQAAVVYDKENDWAIELAQGPRREQRNYAATCQEHYRSLWKLGVPVDVIHQDDDLAGYKLLIAPMVYMLRPGFAQRVEAFVRDGGTFVTTYWSGITDENDLCFLGGFPGPLRKLLGVWSEELDVLYDDEANTVLLANDNPLGMHGPYEAKIFCDLIHAETAHVLGAYGSDFYAGRAALTVNAFGKGEAYYLASRNEQRFQDDLYAALVRKLDIARVLDCDLPEGVTAQMRTDGTTDFIFLMNFSREPQPVDLGATTLRDLLSGDTVSGPLILAPHDTRVLERKR